MDQIEMRHQYEGHAAVCRAGAEKRLESLQAAGGGADADDRESEVRGTVQRSDGAGCVGRLRVRMIVACVHVMPGCLVDLRWLSYSLYDMHEPGLRDAEANYGPAASSQSRAT